MGLVWENCGRELRAAAAADVPSSAPCSARCPNLRFPPNVFDGLLTMAMRKWISCREKKMDWKLEKNETVYIFLICLFSLSHTYTHTPSLTFSIICCCLENFCLMLAYSLHSASFSRLRLMSLVLMASWLCLRSRRSTSSLLIVLPSSTTTVRLAGIWGKVTPSLGMIRRRCCCCCNEMHTGFLHMRAVLSVCLLSLSGVYPSECQCMVCNVCFRTTSQLSVNLVYIIKH